MPNDGQRRRAESAEALMVAAVVAGDENYHELLEELIKSENELKDKVAICINRTAESSAYRRLSEEIISELKNPEAKKRLSDPNNDTAREKFLQVNHKTKVDFIKAKLKQDGFDPVKGTNENMLANLNNESFEKYKKISKP